jgi:hypothetical protein
LSFNLEAVSDGERISRYINEKKKTRPSTGQARYNAFMPPATDFRISVYRTQELEENAVWGIADEFVGTPQKPIIARADLSAIQITQRHLQIENAPHPHPRHANVTGWPEEEELQRVIAIELANIAALVSR